MNAVFLISMIFAAATVSAVPLAEPESSEPVKTRIAIPVSSTTTLHVGRLPDGNPLSILPNLDLMTQWLPGPVIDFLNGLPGFGFGVEVNVTEKPAGQRATRAPRTRRPRN